MALFDAESGQLVWGSASFFRDLLGRDPEGLRVKITPDPFRPVSANTNLQPYNLFLKDLCHDRPKLMELVTQLSTLAKLRLFPSKPMTFPASLPRWQGEVRASIFKWQERPALSLLFHSTEQAGSKEDEARRREALRRLSGSPALTNGDYPKASKLITRVAADTLNASRASIWHFSGPESFCVALYDRKTKTHGTAPAMMLGDYPNYAAKLRTERNIIVIDTSVDTTMPEFSTFFASAGTKATLCCPIRVEGNLFGVLRIEQTDSSRFWTLEEQAFSSSIADFTVIALQSSRVYESERRMNTLFRNLPGTAFRYQCNPLDFVMEYVSEGCLEMTGYTQEELLGKSAAPFGSVIHPEDLPKVYEDVHKMLSMNEPVNTTFRVLHKSGSIRWIWQRGWVAGFSGPYNEYAVVEGFLSDMTELRRLEEKDLTNQSKNEFLESMNKKIRTPIKGVLGTIPLLLNTLLTPMQRKYTETIRHNADVLLSLVSDIVDFAKIDAHKLALEIHDFSPGELLGETCGVYAAAAEEKGLRLILEYSKDFWEHPVFLRGDQARIRQVLSNLLSNAIKFTPRGEVRVNMSYSQGKLRFEVKDTGIGIAPAQEAKIFTSLTWADAAGLCDTSETGLGLCLCKNLCAIMGGEIGLQSALGEGSTFCFSVPLKSSASGPDLNPSPIFIGNCRGKRVLALDPDIDDELRRRLQTLDITLVEVSSLTEAGQKLAEEKHALEQKTLERDPYVLFLLNYESTGLDLGTCLEKIIPYLAGLHCTLALLENGDAPEGGPARTCPVSPESTEGYVLLRRPLSPEALTNLLAHSLRASACSILKSRRHAAAG
ncbi:MAG: PAS domain-containing protein [Deltaproteobacteria bacterium]|nr:PAS domain-containing protein [Deltaproteobacteria bacterium]